MTSSSSYEAKFESLKREHKLEDEVSKVLKQKLPTYKPSLQNSTKIIRSFVYPRSVSQSVADKAPSTSSSFTEFVSYTFYHLFLLVLFLFYSIIRGIEYFYRRNRLRLLALIYNPSQSPQLIRQDISKLDKIPTKISTVLNLRLEQEEGGGVEGLLNDAGEVAAWTIGSGIPYLTLYEYNGILKANAADLVNAINKSLSNYFGVNSLPKFVIKVPRLDLVTYGNGKLSADGYLKEGQKVDLEITLASTKDGKHTIAELTKTMADLAAKNELQPKDITIDLIDSELTDLSGYEPDLLILFGPELDLQGYPPWQIRLSEIYWEPDNDSVNYVVFLNALKKFSTCKVNVGK